MSDEPNFWDEVVKDSKNGTKKEEPKKEEVQSPELTQKVEPTVSTDPFAEQPTAPPQNVEKTEDVPTVTPTVEEPPSPSPPINEPFAEKAGDTKTESTATLSDSNIDSPPPAPSPPESPFGKSAEATEEEEFAKQRPATSGKNLSIMVHGKKGTTKTSTSLSLPGKIFAISFDQQTKIIHEDFFNSDARIEVWDGIEFFNSKNPTTKLETAVKTVSYVNWLLENPCKKFQPDWILLDGTERFTHVCEMAMRAQENLLPYEGVKNRNAWKYRNDLVNNIVQRATQIARLGVVYTSFTEVETVTTALGDEHREGPKWFGDIEQKTQIVIKMTAEKMQGGMAFVALVESSKVSCVPTGRKVVVGERLNSGEIQNNVGIKAIFTPEGYKKYWGTGGE